MFKNYLERLRKSWLIKFSWKISIRADDFFFCNLFQISNSKIFYICDLSHWQCIFNFQVQIYSTPNRLEKIHLIRKKKLVQILRLARWTMCFSKNYILYTMDICWKQSRAGTWQIRSHWFPLMKSILFIEVSSIFQEKFLRSLYLYIVYITDFITRIK